MRRAAALSLGIALCLTGGAVAQTLQAPVMGRLSATEVGIEPMMRISPREYVALAGEAERFEAASARLALARSRMPAVRAFAARLLGDHGPITAALGGAAPQPRLAGVPDYRGWIAALAAARPGDFDRLFWSQQVEAHRHAWALDSGYAADGGDARLKALAMRALAIDAAHLRMLPMRPMRY